VRATLGPGLSRELFLVASQNIGRSSSCDLRLRQTVGWWMPKSAGVAGGHSLGFAVSLLVRTRHCGGLILAVGLVL
jgi:hypothetical protein